MSIIHAIILGLIQGLTEFIPVSSSGHLVLFHHALGEFNGGLAFDVALHFGTLVALMIYFWRDLWEYLKSLFIKSDKTRLTWLLIVATIPAAVIGYLLESRAEEQFRSVRLVGLTMLLFGFIMLLSEHFYRRQKQHNTLEKISKFQALAMGFAQAAAVVPGVSRSGSTITTGLFTGLDRVAATRFSFLLGIPIIGGAVIKVFTEPNVAKEFSGGYIVLVVGVITALFSGLFAIRFMLSYLGRHGLHVFAYYRIALGLLLLVIFSLR